MKTDSKKWLVVGLGNPGKQYVGTRHNLGYLTVQALAKEWGWQFKEEAKFEALVVKGKWQEAIVHLLLPLTYMNASGSAAKHYLDFHEMQPEQLIVVNDDVALVFGHLRVRCTGGPGGHNGLKDIQRQLHTQDYIRLRMGIGHQKDHATLADYVLDVFTADEKALLPGFLSEAVVVLQRLMQEDIAAVMNSINTRQTGVK